MFFHWCNLLVGANPKKRWIYLPLRPQIATFSPGWIEMVRSLRARDFETSALVLSLLVNSGAGPLRSLYERSIKTSTQRSPAS
jgi:hypothetical protein